MGPRCDRHWAYVPTRKRRLNFDGEAMLCTSICLCRDLAAAGFWLREIDYLPLPKRCPQGHLCAYRVMSTDIRSLWTADITVASEVQILASLDEDTVDSILRNPDIIVEFVRYVFDRRFGWSEHIVPEEVPFKKTIIERLDGLLARLSRQSISSVFLHAIQECVSRTSIAVSRSQALQFGLVWLKSRLEENDAEVSRMMDCSADVVVRTQMLCACEAVALTLRTAVLRGCRDRCVERHPQGGGPAPRPAGRPVPAACTAAVLRAARGGVSCASDPLVCGQFLSDAVCVCLPGRCVSIRPAHGSSARVR